MSDQMDAFNYRSYANLISLINTRLPRIDCDIVVGIPRSGIVPGALVATALNVPFSTLNDINHSKQPYVGERKLSEEFNEWSRAKILFVDDSVNNGSQASQIKAKALQLGLNYSILAVYASPNGVKHVDYYLEEVEYPRLFQWNLLNHSYAEMMCYDLDGVLCEDPSREDQKSELDYINFIKSASPRYIPSYCINTIVTSRLEKYRSDTEDWLAANKVQYRQLKMLPHASASDRRSFLLHALYKGEYYHSSDTTLFVESSLYQSLVIARISKKPVFCIENMSMYDAHSSFLGEPVEFLNLYVNRVVDNQACDIRRFDTSSLVQTLKGLVRRSMARINK